MADKIIYNNEVLWNGEVYNEHLASTSNPHETTDDQTGAAAELATHNTNETAHDDIRAMLALKVNTADIVRLNPLSNKKITSLGDSITAQNLWQPLIVDYFDLQHTNLGVSSTSVAGASNATYPRFWERIQTVKNSDPDILLILGGANDWSGDIPIGTDAEFDAVLANKVKTNFKGAYSFIIESLLSWKQRLEIIVLTTLYGDDESENALSLTMRDYAIACKEIAWHYGLPCVDLRGEMGLNKSTSSYYLSDGIHPNQAGGKKMSNLVISKLIQIADKSETDDIVEEPDLIYNEGTEHVAFSTGVNYNPYPAGSVINLSKEQDHLLMSCQRTSGTTAINVGYSTDTKIDLSGYSNLCFELDVELTLSTANCLIGLDPNSRTDINNYYSDLIIKTEFGNDGRRLHVIDVSSMNDSRYIKFFAGCSSIGSKSVVKCYKIWGA